MKRFILIIICLTGIAGVISYSNYINNDIKKRYYKYVYITKDTNLYNKNNKVIGRTYKNNLFKLDRIYKKYYKISGTNYYIYYKDTKRGKKYNKHELNKNYISLNKKISFDRKTTFYDGKRKFIRLDKANNILIDYMDKDYYYVNYLDRLLKVKKSNDININGKSNKGINKISVLYYDSVKDLCNENNCVNTISFKDQINKLKNMGYYTINSYEFYNYMRGNINLKDKTIYIIGNGNDKELNNINIKKFNITNTPSIKGSNSYNAYIMNNGSIDSILEIAKGGKINNIIEENHGVPVLNYHFFYDSKSETCSESICLSTDKFREQLNYLKDNNYHVLSMKEFIDWIYGHIDVPNKSVLLTIDDGAMGTGRHNGNKLIPILEEYKIPATLFLISGWWSLANYKSKYLEVESHTHDMHKYGDCGLGELVCADYNKAREDIAKSVEVLNSNRAFCYPFYSYDEEAIGAIKSLGFKVAFAGGNKAATRHSNKYIIPRYPILSDISMEEFIAILKR